MRPTLAHLLVAAHIHLAAADLQWDGGASSALWGDAANWSGDLLPVGGDTIWFTDGTVTPTTLTLNRSYPDGGAPVDLVFALGHDLRINAAPGCELYLGDVTVLDAQTYTLRVPRNLTQLASGTMPAAGATWDIVAGGTLVVLDDLGSKALASGVWTKTGGGTLRLGDGVLGTLAQPLTQLRVHAGLVELNYILAPSTNGIVGIAEGATVRTLCYNPDTTLLLSGKAVYAAGVTGVAGTFDLNGFDQRWRALSGTATGRVLGNSGLDPATLTLGVGDLSPSIAREADGDFAGKLEDGSTGRLRLVVHGGRVGYTQILSGQNTFTGGTVVRGGRLVLAHATDTLSDVGSLEVDGGTVDLGGNSESIGALTLRAGDILGAGGTLRVSALTVDNAAGTSIGPQLLVDGPATKRGSGTLTLQADATFGQGLTIEGGAVLADGRTLTGDIILQGTELSVGDHIGSIHCTGVTTLTGRVGVGGGLSAHGADMLTTGLTVAGSLLALDTRFAGGSVTIEGTHQLVSWFGVNAFESGLTYGAGSVLEWWVGDDVALGYLDGTSAEERGRIFGAIEVGGAGLVITPGSRLHILAPNTLSDDFWLNPRTFRLASLMEGASITGAFLLSAPDGSEAAGWSSTNESDGIYLHWAGMTAATPAPVPEASAVPLAGAMAILTAWIRRRLLAGRA